MTITMKTAVRLSGRAMEIAAIAEALYGAGFKAESEALAHAAGSIASVAISMENKLADYAAAALSDDAALTTKGTAE